MAQVEAKSESPGRESIQDALDRSLEETDPRLKAAVLWKLLLWPASPVPLPSLALVMLRAVSRRL